MQGYMKLLQGNQIILLKIIFLFFFNTFLFSSPNVHQGKDLFLFLNRDGTTSVSIYLPVSLCGNPDPTHFSLLTDSCQGDNAP
jgi:hypothetical protein